MQINISEVFSLEGKIFQKQLINSTNIEKVIAPSRNEELFTVGIATKEDVFISAQQAKESQTDWQKISIKEKQQIFLNASKYYESIDDEVKELMCLESGSTKAKVEVELKMAAAVCKEAASLITHDKGLVLPSDGSKLSYAKRIPHGVVGVISPFNFPLILSIRAVAPALAVGNSVVLKPDIRTPILGGLLTALIFKKSGLPEGVLHVLPGNADAGEAICTAPEINVVSFTGSTSVGRKVGELASRNLKKVTLELGGKNNLIILPDADLEKAASNACWGAYLHQGQICMATGLIFVHESIYENFMLHFFARASRLECGDPIDNPKQLGPIISAKQVQSIHEIVSESVSMGAKLTLGGTYEGNFYQPTILENISTEMPCFKEEIFGPVASVIKFSDEKELIELANLSGYGLSLGIITNDFPKAFAIADQIPTGLLHINDQTVSDDASIPFGGVGLSGNGGRHGGPASIEEFTQWKWITVDSEPNVYPF